MNIQEFEKEVGDKLPEQLREQATVKFLPQLNLNLAHLSTDILIRQAGKYSFDPYRAGKDIAAAFQNHPEFILVSEQGYLNLFLRNIKLQVPEVKALPAELKIFLPPAAFIKNNSAFIRLYCGATLQALLAQKSGVAVEFHYGRGTFFRDFAKQIKSPLEAVLDEASVTNDLHEYSDFLIQQMNSSDLPLTLWFSPECLPKNIYSRFYENHFKNSGRSLVCPPKLYLHGLGAWDCNYFKGLENQDFYRALICLAGPAESDELSIVESSLAVKANLQWYLSSLLKRLPVLESDSGDFFQISELSVAERELALYSVNLPGFIQQAIEYGAVRELLSVLYKLSDGINSYFNTPDLRHRLSEEKLTKKEVSIITVVRQALSSIYPALLNFD